MTPNIHLRNDFKGMRCEYRRRMVNAGQMLDAPDFIVDGLESAFAQTYTTSNGSPLQIIWAITFRTA
jgi:hypothetical protein